MCYAVVVFYPWFAGGEGMHGAAGMTLIYPYPVSKIGE